MLRTNFANSAFASAKLRYAKPNTKVSPNNILSVHTPSNRIMRYNPKRSFHNTNAIRACRTYSDEEYLTMAHDRANNFEKKLCKANTLLYKYASGYRLTNDDLEVQAELLNFHKTHRLEEHRLAKDAIISKIDNICKRMNNKPLRKELAEKIESLFISETDPVLIAELVKMKDQLQDLEKMTEKEIMDRNNF